MKIQYIFISYFLIFFCLSLVYADIGGYDFGDKNSETLTAKAWNALNEKDYKAVLVYTKKCVSLYESRAKTQQNLLKDYPEGDNAFKQWALNDVGTCYYLMGEAYFAKKKYKLAKRAYSKVVRSLSFAQYYDPEGIHIKVVVSCRKKLVALEYIMKKDRKKKGRADFEKIDIRDKLEEFDKNKTKFK